MHHTMFTIVVAMNAVVDATWLSKMNVFVDFSSISYPASTRATGFLFGLQNGTPADGLITDLLPQTYRCNQWVDVYQLGQAQHSPIRPVVVLSDRYGVPPGWRDHAEGWLDSRCLRK
ncbi:MAG: hypothetical protein GYA24_10265 [Candidatus Lokiarchaeota archaeon]|nr:hypothetical protein [Candidatus Lokiarchaeota archaeon]